MYIWKNGNRYSGNFEHDNINGYGEMKYANGDIYTGEWKDGLRCGIGKFSSNESVIFARWENDKDIEQIDEGIFERINKVAIGKQIRKIMDTEDSSSVGV